MVHPASATSRPVAATLCPRDGFFPAVLAGRSDDTSDATRETGKGSGAAIPVVFELGKFAGPPRRGLVVVARSVFQLRVFIVDAMFAESRRQAFCIATDSTSASMRAKGECESWHVFVFVADHRPALRRG